HYHVLRALGDHRKAAAIIRESLDTWLKDYDARHTGVRFCKALLAKDRGDMKQAKEDLNALIDDAARTRDPRDIYPVIFKRALVEVLAWNGDDAEAAALAASVPPETRLVSSGTDHFYVEALDMQARILAEAPEGPRNIPHALALAEANVKAFPNDGQFLT